MKNIDTSVCPICLSTGTLEKSMIPHTVRKGHFSKEIRIVNYKCSSCEEEGDFFLENDEKIKEVISELDQKIAIESLEKLEEKKIKFSNIERAFSIPARTLSKWKNKNKKPSAAAISLLRLVNLYPWLIEVAENNFDEKYSVKFAPSL